MHEAVKAFLEEIRSWPIRIWLDADGKPLPAAEQEIICSRIIQAAAEVHKQRKVCEKWLKYPKATPSEIQRAKDYLIETQATENARQEAIDALVLKNMAFVVRCTNKLAKPNDDYEDIFSSMRLGALKAAERYNPDASVKKARFITYAQFWMRQTYLEVIVDGRGSKIPAPMRKLLNQLREYLAQYSSQNQAEPTTEEICDHLHIYTAKYIQLLDFQASTTYLSELVNGNEDIIWESALAAPDNEVENHGKRLADQEAVRAALGTLTPRQRRMTQVRYGFLDGETRSMDEVAYEFGLVRQRMGAIEEDIMKALRVAMLKQQMQG